MIRAPFLAAVFLFGLLPLIPAPNGAAAPATPRSGEPAGTAAAVLERGRRIQMDIHDLRAHLTEIVSYSGLPGGRPVEADLTFIQPDALLVRYAPPDGRVLAVRGKEAWLFLPSANQVLHDAGTSAGAPAPGAADALPDGRLFDLLGGTDRLARMHPVADGEETIEIVRGEPALRCAVLRVSLPGGKTEGTIFLDDRWLLPVRTRWSFGGTITMTTTLSAVRVNSGVPAADVAFKAPPGAESLESRFWPAETR